MLNVNQAISPELLLAVAVFGVILVAALLVQAYVSRVRAARDARMMPSGDDSGEFFRPALPSTGVFGRMDVAFEQAVSRTGMEISPAGTLAFVAFCGVTLAGIVHFWKDNLLFTLGAAMLGMGIPLLAVAFLQARYRRQIQEQLPDALYALARSLRAGLGLEQALEAFAQQGNKPVSSEIARAVSQLRLGLPITTALETVAVRVRLLDFNVFVSTIALYRQAGGNLALLLDRLAESVRERNLFRGRFAAATAQGRAVAIILAAFGPLLLLGYAIWEPDHVRAFFDHTTGWMILLGCLAMEAIGAVWMWNLLKVEY
jgi:tight adherence protein B